MKNRKIAKRIRQKRIYKNSLADKAVHGLYNIFKPVIDEGISIDDFVAQLLQDEYDSLSKDDQIKWDLKNEFDMLLINTSSLTNYYKLRKKVRVYFSKPFMIKELDCYELDFFNKLDSIVLKYSEMLPKQKVIKIVISYMNNNEESEFTDLAA